MDKVSIVTVCYNAEKTIKNTIESVLNQNYINYEYIIIDGVSTDSTLLIIDSFRESFTLKGVKLTVLSEPDKGIYDAMNKGIDYVSGEWVIFMNADDSFYDANVLTQIFSQDLKEYDIVYGACMRNDGFGSYYARSEPVEILPKRMPFAHQSVFVRKTLMAKYKFDLKYKLSADYNFFFTVFVENYNFLQTDFIICNYSIRGISGKSLVKCQKEVIDIKRKFQDQYPILFIDRIKWKIDMLVRMVKMNLPEKLLQILRRLKNR